MTLDDFHSADEAMRKCLDLLLDQKSKDINYSIGKTCLEGASNEFFFAYIEEGSASKGASTSKW